VNLVVSSGPATYSLTTAASPVGGGIVNPASGGLYSAGTVISLKATPEPGYVFSSWTSSPVAVVNASKASTTITMIAAAETATANFVPALKVNPISLNYNTVYQGTTTVKYVTVMNLGTTALTISSPSISNITGGDSNEYKVSNGCPSSLASLKSCIIKVSFVAGAFYAPQTATLNVNGSPGSRQMVGISALVIDPKVKLSPTSLSFGTQKVGMSSTAKPITVTNTGATALTIKSVTVAGSDPLDFIAANHCPASLAAGNNCTIEVTFKPKAKGSRSAKVSITDNAQNSPQSITLSGTGD
jgi:hypothetical protein